MSQAMPKLIDAKKNLAEAYVSGLVKFATDMGVDNETATQKAYVNLVSTHPEWIDAAWLTEYRAAMLQAKFEESPNKAGLLELAHSWGAASQDYDNKKAASIAFKGTVPVDYAFPDGALDIMSAGRIRGELDAAIAKAVESCKTAQSALDTDAAQANALVTKAANDLREALDASGFAAYVLSSDGKLAPRPSGKAKAKSVGGANHTGKRGQPTQVVINGVTTRYDNLVAACNALGVDIPEHGVGWDRGAQLIGNKYPSAVVSRVD